MGSAKISKIWREFRQLQTLISNISKTTGDFNKQKTDAYLVGQKIRCRLSSRIVLVNSRPTFESYVFGFGGFRYLVPPLGGNFVKQRVQPVKCQM